MFSALLDITQAGLAQILGLSPSTVSRMANGTYTLDAQKKRKASERSYRCGDATGHCLADDRTARLGSHTILS
jgi:transcriptional regulator with XRE-family HTH domain